MAAARGSATDGTVAHVVDLLGEWGQVAARRMFRSHGLFRDGVMFGLINRDVLYFKTGDGNRGDYEAMGMAPFCYARGKKRVALGYHAVPAEALDDAEALAIWAEKAYAVAISRKALRDPGAGRRAAPKRSERTARGRTNRP